MPITYDITTDGLYQKGIVTGLEKGREEGIEKGREETMEKTVRKLLTTGLLTPEEIAGSLEIALEYVLKIQSQITSSE